MKKLLIPICIIISLAACNRTHTDKNTVKAFVALNDALNHDNYFISEINETNRRIENAFVRDPKAAKPFFDASGRVSKLSDVMVYVIHNLKTELVSEKSGKSLILDGADTMLQYVPNLAIKINMPDSIGHELKRQLNEYRKYMIDVLKDKNIAGEKDTMRIGIDLLTPQIMHNEKDDHKETWEAHIFNDLPLAADVVLLTNLQQDVRRAELKFLMYFYDREQANWQHYKDSLRATGHPLIRI